MAAERAIKVFAATPFGVHPSGRYLSCFIQLNGDVEFATAQAATPTPVARLAK